MYIINTNLEGFFKLVLFSASVGQKSRHSVEQLAPLLQLHRIKIKMSARLDILHAYLPYVFLFL